MTKRAFLAFSVLLSAAPLLSQCPDNGQIVVFHPDKGFRAIRFFGDSTVEGFFPGSTFKWIEPSERNPEPTFWVDDMLVQWICVPRTTFLPEKSADEGNTLEAYYRYEIKYLMGVSKKDQSRLHLERFIYTPKVSPDKAPHTFSIWRATPGTEDDETPQYWIATLHPRGVMVMTLIPGKLVDEKKMKILMDSYMADYCILRPDQCKEAAKMAHDFKAAQP